MYLPHQQPAPGLSSPKPGRSPLLPGGLKPTGLRPAWTYFAFRHYLLWPTTAQNQVISVLRSMRLSLRWKDDPGGKPAVGLAETGRTMAAYSRAAYTAAAELPHLQRAAELRQS